MQVCEVHYLKLIIVNANAKLRTWGYLLVENLEINERKMMKVGYLRTYPQFKVFNLPLQKVFEILQVCKAHYLQLITVNEHAKLWTWGYLAEKLWVNETKVAICNEEKGQIFLFFSDIFVKMTRSGVSICLLLP